MTEEKSIMAVNLPAITTLTPIAGVRISTHCAQIKQAERDDMALFELAEGTTCAAVFTRNAFCAAPVTLSKRHLEQTAPRYLLVNAGNANAGTGEQGFAAAQGCCAEIARLTGGQTEQTLVFSTGVIGLALPTDKMYNAMPDLVANLAANVWEKAATAIMTTDTQPKGLSVTGEIDGKPITVTGVAKGSGMIRPDMATLLVFIATDAAVPQDVLQQCLNEANNVSFNRITVDGDTSTNDSCILAATGQGEAQVETVDSEAYRSLLALVTQVCQNLAQACIRDGEGASKFISIRVEEGATEEECLEVAYTVAHSPLVKTAFYASDANWGRILAAVGRAGINDLNVETLRIYLDDVCIVEKGGVAASYTEEAGSRVMAQTDICVRIVLARGQASTEVWTCDLSKDYVRINADYRS